MITGRLDRDINPVVLELQRQQRLTELLSNVSFFANSVQNFLKGLLLVNPTTSLLPDDSRVGITLRDPGAGKPAGRRTRAAQQEGEEETPVDEEQPAEPEPLLPTLDPAQLWFSFIIDNDGHLVLPGQSTTEQQLYVIKDEARCLPNAGSITAPP